MVQRLKEDKNKGKKHLENILYRDDELVIKYSPPTDVGELEMLSLVGKYERQHLNILIHRDDEGFFYKIEKQKSGSKAKVYLGGSDLRDTTCLVDEEISYCLKQAKKKLSELKEQKLDALKAIKVEYALKLLENTRENRVRMLNKKKEIYKI